MWGATPEIADTDTGSGTRTLKPPTELSAYTNSTPQAPLDTTLVNYLTFRRIAS
jgi:hypothetical protein